MPFRINNEDFDHQVIDGVEALTRKPFKCRPRKKVVTQLMFHEPVGPRAERTEATLRKNGYGVHLHVTEDAELLQYNDLHLDVTSHAGKDANGRSISIECQNPYVPKANGDAPPPWLDVIKAPWAWAKKGRARLYVVPTIEQLELCATIVDVLTSCSIDGIEIPREWPALMNKGMQMGPRPHAWSHPGVLSHMVSGVHADGSFVVLYCYLRLLGGMSATDTRKMAMGLATKRIAQVHDIIT